MGNFLKKMNKGRLIKVQGDCLGGEKIYKAYNTLPHSVKKSIPVLPASQMLFLRKMDATGR